MQSASEFLLRLRNTWDAGTFVKLTLSDPDSAPEGLRNLKARPVELKEGRRLCILECFATREVTKNYPIAEGAELLATALASSWRRAHLFTTAGDFQFRRERSGKMSVRTLRSTFTQAPSFQHDKVHPEQAALASEPFLQRLGVTNPLGAPRPGMAGKLRQVQRFTELLGHLLDEWGWKGDRPLQVADMGAGKGYLTFALARVFQKRGWQAQVIGVEARPELVAASNALSQELGFSGLRFEAGRIGEWHPKDGLDVLVALHACNTATDDALFQGVNANAGLLVTSPCCHQEVRPQVVPPAPLQSILAHGILLERHAEILTDGLRALLLELRGYRARVFEFVEPEHSGKNLMLAAIRRESSGGRSPEAVRAEIRDLLAAYQIKTQRLAAHLGEIL
ncbi:MAG: SAM-dependent methyltransferase [Verrucomicrobiota bacterium]